MRKALFILLFLVLLAAWWAVSSTTPAPAADTWCPQPADYPPDFEERLGRITRIRLSCAPAPAAEPEWQNPQQQPPAGHARARQGGTVRMPNAGPFPAHFLQFGGSVQFFQQNLQAATTIPLIARHPLTRETTAGVAEAWAFDGNCLYFRLNPLARYNNGRPVRAADYLLALLLQAEQGCAEFEDLAHTIHAVRCHGEHILAIECRHQTDPVQLCARLHPAEPGFYASFCAQFRKTYAQRIPPGTGPYKVTHVERGRCIRLEKVQNWWGQSLPLCQNRFNPDTLEHHFLTSEAQVWEFFHKGKLDMIQTRNIATWHEQLDAHPGLPTLVYDAEYPLPPYGIALNTRTLPDLNLRKGLLHAMDMERAVQDMMHGEGQRLKTFSSGYGSITPRNTSFYTYNPTQARRYFALAGYTLPGSDGILRNEAGKKLCVRLLYTPHDKISRIMSTLAQSAAACGAEIQLEPLPWQSCHRRMQERSHEMAFWAVPAESVPNPSAFLHPSAAPDMAPFCLNDEDMNGLLQKFHPESAELLAAIDRRISELAIWLPGWKENRVYIIHQPHLHIPPSLWCYDAADAHLFWVEKKA